MPIRPACTEPEGQSARPSPAATAQACQRFLPLLGDRAHLLIAGCGTGEDLVYFRQQGLMVTAFDANLSQARIASHRTGQPVRVCSTDNMRSKLPYHGIWANGSLPGLADPALADQLVHLISLLKPEGPLYCTFLDNDNKGSRDISPSTRRDRLQQLIAPLPLILHHHWYSEPWDKDPQSSRWHHALLLRV